MDQDRHKELKELAKKRRREAYERAKALKKEYAKSPEVKAQKEEQKAKARELRRKRYQEDKAKAKAQKAIEKQKKEAADDMAKELEALRLTPVDLKLVKFDPNEEKFKPVTPAPLLRLIPSRREGQDD